MIIWGTGGDLISLGSAGTRPCQTCEKERNFNVVLQYRYFHLYWLFGAVTEKSYLLVCEVCQRGWTLEKDKIEADLKKLPIPFMRRYGFLVLGGIFVAVIGFAILSK